MRVLPLSLFGYNSSLKRLTAEASELGPGAMFQVFPDSIDMGVTIHSHHTGQESTFVVDHIEVDREGDILYWDMIPTDKSLRDSPRLSGMTVRVYND